MSCRQGAPSFGGNSRLCPWLSGASSATSDGAALFAASVGDLAAMAAPAAQVPDKGWMTLRRRGRVWFLEHHGTGERVALGFESGARQLEFSSVGEGVLVHPSEDLVLASSLFSKGFFQAPRGGGDGNLDYFVGTSSSSTLRTCAEWKFKALCFKRQPAALAPPFACEVFCMEVRLGPSYLWWGMQRIKSYVFPNVMGHNWCGKNHLGWVGKLEKLGLGSDHVQASRHADVYRSNDDCQRWDSLGAGLSDFALPTAALLALATYWHHRDIGGCMRLGDMEAGALFGAALIVDAVVEGVLSGIDFTIGFPFLGGGVSLVVRDGKVPPNDIDKLRRL